jgi:non-specific serine/threonine protein kinase
MYKTLIALIQPKGSYVLDWQENTNFTNPAAEAQESYQEVLYQNYLKDPAEALFLLGFQDKAVWFSPSIHFLKNIADLFTKAVSQNPDLEVLRDKIKIEFDEEEKKRLLENAPYLVGFENLNRTWLESVWGKLHLVFTDRLATHKGSAASLLSSLNPHLHLAGRVFFHLVENKKDEQPFAFLATYTASITPEGKAKHVPLKHALVEFGKNSKKLLELLVTVQKAALKSPFIAEILESGEIFYPLTISAGEAYTILKEIPVYEASGIICRIPHWWKNKSGSINVTINIGNKQPSFVGKDALLDFDMAIALNGEQLSRSEAKKLLSEAEGLALIKGRWVEIDHKKLKEALAAYEAAHELTAEAELSFFEALRMQLNPEKLLGRAAGPVDISITNGEWLTRTIAKLANPAAIETVTCSQDFKAILRPYQQQGLNWLTFMYTLRFGACLADDMGLGKTVQVLALLDKLRQSGDGKKTLLVVPASLLANWVAEIGRFAPALKYFIAHPSENKDGPAKAGDEVTSCDLIITTYSLLAKFEWLKAYPWSCLIIDEAQAIKNPGTKQTRAVKQLKADYKVAMTGTPIENRLTDLWSLFDFINPGLLGTIKEFGDFARQLQNSNEGYSRLKKVVGPFILRRLKTDKSIIDDLPEKIEMKTYTSLTKKQVVLYKELLAEVEEALTSQRSAAGRRGLILASLIKFKQLCNHPDHYLGGTVYAEEESGKYSRLREIGETIYAKRERVLVFTQFQEITTPLKSFLESIFYHQGLVLHGGTPVARRKEIVERFQQDEEYVPFLVLSLKAGGVGLNLTKANHVIHFDRWWNPAVENQATDRAFRIGQHKNVVVHKFITKGTIEEKIDSMIESKTGLAATIITDKQETWLTEMSNQELLDLFRLAY